MTKQTKNFHSFDQFKQKQQGDNNNIVKRVDWLIVV